MAGWRFYLDNVEVEEPIGWDAIEFTAVRTDNHGVDQPFSTTVQFYGKGAHILKTAFDTNFVSAEVILKIVSDQQVVGQVPYVYSAADYEFNGIIDFATYEEINTCDTDSWSVSVGILQDTFRDKFKSRYDVEIDLFNNTTLDGTGMSSGELLANNIRLHSQAVLLLASGGTLAERNADIMNQDYGPTPACAFNNQWFECKAKTVIPCYWDISDFEDGFGTTLDNGDPFWDGTNVMFVNNQSITRDLTFSWEAFTVKYDFYYSTLIYHPPPSPPLNNQTMNVVFRINKWDSSGNIISSSTIQADTGTSKYMLSGQDLRVFNINAGQFTITLAAGQRVNFSLDWGTGGTVKYITTTMFSNEQVITKITIPTNVRFSIQEANPANASFARAIPIFQFLRRIIQHLTSDISGLVSDCFSENTDGIYANNSITTGLLLRNYSPPSGQAIQVKTSFKKAFESIAAIFGVGWAFEKQSNGKWKIRIEPYSYFYQNEVQLEFANVEQLKITSSTDKFYSQLKLGYDDNWKNMALGGLDAICTDRNYFLDNKAIQYGSSSTLEMLSEIIAEGIAIEYSRRLQFFDTNSGSSDRPNDYNLFIIWTIRDNYTIPAGEDNNPEYRTEGETGTINLVKYRASWAANFQNGNAPRWGDALSRYNLFHTSARLAVRHWPLLGMNLHGMINPTMQFQVGQYRTRFSSAVNNIIQPNVIELTSSPPSSGTLLAEDGNILAAIIRDEFKDYFLKPIIFEFEYPQAFCDFIQLANYTPYRKVKVKMGNTTVSGWILEIKNKPEDNSGGTTVFTLMASNIPDPEPIGERAYSDAYSNAYL